ncbi:MAG TPA: methyltransferase domain-containing protein [Burkholderiales bacterium]|nr:methyltransferase domain-containing protein [Burkholderiales bacterium]
MHVFISWSGDRSKALAACVKDWLGKLVQASEPWMSEEIDAGQRWNEELCTRLRQANFGVICLTPENLTAPWVLFEAGALAKAFEAAHVVPVLLGVEKNGIAPPLSQFQAVKADCAGLRKLATDVNKALGAVRLPERRLNELFDELWPKLEKRIAEISAEPGPDILHEAHAVHEEIHKAFVTTQRHLGKPVAPRDRDHVLEAVTKTVAPLRKMQQRLQDWGERANDWINDFHTGLKDYVLIFATDVMERSSIGSPRFERYLRMQYAAKLRSLEKGSPTTVPRECSKSLIDAIHRTGWKTSALLELRKYAPGDLACAGLQIVRILIRPMTVLDDWEKDALQVIDFDHQLYGIPLFVVDAERLDAEEISDFAIGFGRNGKFKKCYEFVEEVGAVVGQPLKRSDQLTKIFLKMLDDPTLKTVGEYLGYVMIQDPEKSVEFAAEYDSRRQPSGQIIDFISDRLGEKLAGQSGLDVGCGTGNYTFPFAGRFESVTGLDINEKLLEIARAKAQKKSTGNVYFERADAVSTPFGDRTFDAVWSVSTMHYLRGRRQYSFLEECFRILKQRGMLILDIGEFLDQHPSLWACEYFPSLRQRYKDSLFTAQHYAEWLGKIGFSSIQCVPLAYKAGEDDLFIRAGQHNPDLYLSDEFTKANPAFWEMPKSEVLSGQEKIRMDKESGELSRVISRCEHEASMPGDFGFIVAMRS